MPEPPARTDSSVRSGSALPEATPSADARAVAALAGPVPLALPPVGTRLDRIQEHTEALVDTVKDWAELRIKLAQTELEQKAQVKINQMVWARAVPLLLVGIAALFLLVTLALGLGWLLGHAFWGFLIVTVILVVSAGGVAYFNRATLRNLSEGAEVDVSTTSHV